MWYAYELTGNDTLKTWAIQYTNLLNPVRYYTGTLDLGFMVNCSYGNAPSVWLQRHHCSRNEKQPTTCADASTIPFSYPFMGLRNMELPVIIDNMMNLDLLFNVKPNGTGDNK